jgi:AraC-like DNA-binding protein
MEEHYASFDMTFAPDRLFFAQVEITRFESILADRFRATLTRGARTTQHIAADGNDDLFVGLNCGKQSMVHRQCGREVEHKPGSILLLSNGEPGVVMSDAGTIWLSVYVPRAQLLERMAHAEALVAKPLSVDYPVAKYLRRYLEFLFEPDTHTAEPILGSHVATTLIDLVVLCLGANRDSEELAKLRGLRAARLQEILSLIGTDFADPALSAAKAGLRLGLSARYVQELLQETGRTFTQRVLELRLQKARAMLSDPRHNRLKIGEIAYACGFNEDSYFNRCFRRRFGASPTQFRGNGECT